MGNNKLKRWAAAIFREVLIATAHSHRTSRQEAKSPAGLPRVFVPQVVNSARHQSLPHETMYLRHGDTESNRWAAGNVCC
jgi:hypothetical protein